MMRRWWWLAIGLSWLAPSFGAIVIGRDGAALSERVMTRVGPDGQVEAIIDGSFDVGGHVFVGTVQLLYAVPAKDLTVELVPGGMLWPDPKPEPVIRRPWMITSIPLFLEIVRGQAHPAVPKPVSTPITEGQVAAPVLADPAALEALALTDAQRVWAAKQAEAGRRLVVVDAPTGPDATVHAWPVRFTYRADPPLIPFSAAQSPASGSQPSEPSYTLLILAETRMQPTYPDGYRVLDDYSVQCAEPNPTWLGGLGPAKYATLYEANVPVTARTADLLLKPEDSSPVPPPPPRVIDQPRPIPLDAITGSALLAALILWFVKRRRRKADTTSSASEPDLS